MKQLIVFVYLFFVGISCYSQNLVVNPSFEEYNTCPDGLGSIPAPDDPLTMLTTILKWSRPSAASSDYFAGCDILPIADVPTNAFGNQDARSGTAYVGTYSTHMSSISVGGDYREYIQGKLSASLIAGRIYFVNYWISLSDNSLLAVDQHGAFLSEDSVYHSSLGTPLSLYTPSVTAPEGVIYDDQENWMSVSGFYTASGNEKWIILGNFEPSNDLNIAGDTSDHTAFAYYYYDDVCVLDMEGVPAVVQVWRLPFCVEEGTTIDWSDSSYSCLLWDNGDTGRVREVSAPGVYWVKYVDNNCTLFIDSFIAEAGPPDTVSISLGNDTIICSGAGLTLTVDERFADYIWSNGSSDSSITTHDAGTYFVTASSTCYFATDTINIGIYPQPEISLPEDTLLCDGMVLSIGMHEEGLKYHWNTGADECCIDIAEPGAYILEVENICGDRSRDEINVGFLDCSDCFMFPNAFSPNGDGLNDIFLPVAKGCPIEKYSLRIYNRWGQLVYFGNKVDKGWNGIVNGIPADAGVYYFYTEALSSGPSSYPVILKGDVTLIR